MLVNLEKSTHCCLKTYIGEFNDNESDIMINNHHLIYTEYGVSSSVSTRSLKLSNAGPGP